MVAVPSHTAPCSDAVQPTPLQHKAGGGEGRNSADLKYSGFSSGTPGPHLYGAAAAET